MLLNNALKNLREKITLEKCEYLSIKNQFNLYHIQKHAQHTHMNG